MEHPKLFHHTTKEEREEWLQQQFEFELCEFCGKDADQHTVVPMAFGLLGYKCNEEC
jgi:hypothetical protein